MGNFCKFLWEEFFTIARITPLKNLKSQRVDIDPIFTILARKRKILDTMEYIGELQVRTRWKYNYNQLLQPDSLIIIKEEKVE